MTISITGQHAQELYHEDPINVAAAMAGMKEEKALGFKKTLVLYRKAALWSMCISLALVMEGYDVGIINSFWGQNSFLEKFGSVRPDGGRYIPANWQAALNNAASIGQLIGLTINGYIQPRFGSRRIYMAAMLMMIATIFVPVFSTSLPMLFGGELLCGIPWGVFQTLTTVYAVEVCPMALRGYLAAFVNMCWGMGLLLSAGVVRASLRVDSAWGWRVPFMLQWIWPVPLLILAYFAPESPWWLVKAGKIEEAKQAARRLSPATYLTEERLEQQIALISHTIELEKAEVAGATYRDCFRGSNLRRTEIVIAVWAAQYWNGQNIINYSTQFLRDGGLSEAGAFNIFLAITATYIVGTIACWFLMARIDRRAIYMWGFIVMGVLQLLVGILGFVQTVGATIGIGAILVIMNFTFSCSLGPVCYTIAAEIPATRLRAQTVVMGRMVYLISSIVCNQITPRMFDKTGWNWGAKSGLFWMGFDIAFAVYMFFRLPETKDRMFSELNVLFAERVPARKFSLTTIEYVSATNESGKHDEKLDVAHMERQSSV